MISNNMHNRVFCVQAGQSSGGLHRRPGIGPALMPEAIAPGRDEQRGEGGAANSGSSPGITSTATRLVI